MVPFFYITLRIDFGTTSFYTKLVKRSFLPILLKIIQLCEGLIKQHSNFFNSQSVCPLLNTGMVKTSDLKMVIVTNQF